MRVISQDGTSDYPYDEIGLSIGWNGEKTEYYIFWNSIQRQMGSKIAVYSSLEKVKKAMEMLRTAYQGNKIEETYHEGTNYYHSIFQFPADDEVEG